MKPSFFRNNRKKLVEKIGGALVVIAAYNKTQRMNDMAHIFEQEANFWYLCGIEAADWLLIIDGNGQKSWLVAPEIDEVHQTFDGSLSSESAQLVSGVDSVVSHSEGRSLLRQLARKHSMVYTIGHPSYSAQYDFSLNANIMQTKQLLEQIFARVQECNNELNELRAIKQPEEIVAIKKAVRTTISAFEQVKSCLPTLRYEYEIAAEFDYEIKKRNARHAYDPIVAAGKNACTLHYTDNSARLAKPNLILCDVGARVDGYAADITRTLAYGNLTKRQIAVYAAVQKAQQQIIAMLKPGLSVTHYQSKVDTIMIDALKSLCLVKTDNIAALRRYMPHAVSHGLGVDVHDSLGRPRYFEPNMVLTVEPGIYIPEEKIGVRIEDDILVTEKRATNLSAKLSTVA